MTSLLHPLFRFPALALVTVAIAVPASAQVQPAHVATPAERAAFQERADAQKKLAGALSRIAQDGNNGYALLDAGEAAIALNDPQAALGFLARAEHAMPREARVKSALGAAMMGIGKDDQALRYFGEAESLGARERTYLGERALAYELSGDGAAAQRDYRAALAIKPGDPTLTRNYALSMGIAGNSKAALAILNPLLASQDRAAWRAQAFILAMNGQTDEAAKTVDAMMPVDLARGIKPYLARMDNLTPVQKAAAVHLGRFPTGPLAPSDVRLASADTRVPAPTSTRKPTRAERDAARRAARDQAQREKAQRESAARALPPPVRTATVARSQPTVVASASPRIVPPTPTPTPSPPPAMPEIAQRAEPIRSTQLPPSSVVQPGFSGNASASATPSLPPAQEITIAPRTMPSAPTATPTSVYGPTSPTAIAPAPEKSLFDIVNAIDVAPASERPPTAALSAAELERIKQETLAEQAAEEKRAAVEKAKAQAAAKAKQEADAKAKAEADAKKAEKLAKAANPARFWVQVATGGEAKALAFDFRRLAKKYPEQFKGQDGWTSQWGQTRRLVVGPFDSLKEAKAWDAGYRKAGGDSFTWSSTDGLEVEKLPGK
ncbi:SPOR domain-containing protein [Sphingorhabdus soli]|uniref:SPOR domain-containing protein n=1 Tax=Flavisphingopyxis soli TaxID=2601267 RepID=A0A5C6UAK9_9SPHN|nr:SPOR domain-containing protein [Sphingorhabdus soli]TXC68738.1 SPOR domain-containing protein [Sphingorhabdus soli]